MRKLNVWGSRGGTGPVWANRLLRSLAGQWGTSADPRVLRSMGQFVPLTESGARRPPERGERLQAWTRTQQLTYGEAEALLALVESTPWYHNTSD